MRLRDSCLQRELVGQRDAFVGAVAVCIVLRVVDLLRLGVHVRNGQRVGVGVAVRELFSIALIERIYLLYRQQNRVFVAHAMRDSIGRGQRQRVRLGLSQWHSVPIDLVLA